MLWVQGLVLRVLSWVLSYVLVESFESLVWWVGDAPKGRFCVRDSCLIYLI